MNFRLTVALFRPGSPYAGESVPGQFWQSSLQGGYRKRSLISKNLFILCWNMYSKSEQMIWKEIIFRTRSKKVSPPVFSLLFLVIRLVLLPRSKQVHLLHGKIYYLAPNVIGLIVIDEMHFLSLPAHSSTFGPRRLTAARAQIAKWKAY